MCRNIRTLFNFEPPITEEEIRAASLQFVRKISGFNTPSRVNEAAFNAAVDDFTRAFYSWNGGRHSAVSAGPAHPDHDGL